MYILNVRLVRGGECWQVYLTLSSFFSCDSKPVLAEQSWLLVTSIIKSNSYYRASRV